jgi:hypothetical protein
MIEEEKGNGRWTSELGMEGLEERDLSADGEEMVLLYSVFCTGFCHP